MRPRTKPFLAAVAAIALLAGLPAAQAEEAADLITYVGVGGAALTPRAGIVASDVRLETALLEQRSEALRLRLPDGLAATARLESFERRGAGDLVWRGAISDDAGIGVVLTLKNGFVVGRIQTAEAIYELRPTAGGGQVLEKLDLSRFPPCSGGLEAQAAAGLSLGLRGLELAQRDAPDSIDVMGVYTAQARDGAGGVAQIEATIQSAVDNANTSFINSDMIARFNLVHTALVSRNDSGNISSDLSWLASSPEVAALRDTHNADMVGMLVENGGGFCGVAYVMRNPGPAFESSAFQVTARTCAVGNLSYAHEHGHNMGFEHDPANGTTPSNASYPWSFGHFVNGSYRTVMSYSNQCTLGCTRVTQFSNPDVVFSGAPTGIAEQRDNARTGDLTAPIVTDFRTSTTCGDGVREGSEECDGADLGGATCADNGCTGGTVSCTASCTLDYSACTGCPVCDNDGVCEAGEDCNNCALDCPSGSGSMCGNGICEAGNGEDCLSCAADCAGQQSGKPSNRYCCGDGAGENPVTCGDSRCTSGTFQCTDTPAGSWCCGDGICEGGESSSNCEIDCGPPPMCVPLGSACTTTADCCTGKCKGAGGGLKTCQ